MEYAEDDFAALLGDTHTAELQSAAGAARIGGILDTPIAVTWFNSNYDTEKRETQPTIRELAEQITAEHGTTKADLRAIKLARFGDKRTDGETGALRNNDNVLAVSGVEGEHDAGTITFEEAGRRLAAARLAALLVTTSGHTPAHPKWRVFLPLSTELAPGHRAALAARLNGLFDGELDQHATFTLSQLQYVGSVGGGHPIQVRLFDGRALDTAGDLDAKALLKRQRRDCDDVPSGEEGLLAAIAAGESYHDSFVSLAGIWCNNYVREESSIERLRAAMEEVPAELRDKRWRRRLKQMPNDVRDIYRKDARKWAEWIAWLEDLPPPA
jgi:hypothetical protein